MDSPTLTDQVGGYQIVWSDIQIEAKVSRLHVHSDGHVTGMLMLTHNNGTGPVRLLPNTQMNFSAEVTRAKHAKQLQDKYSHLGCSWVEMFDYMGEAVQQAALSGSPAIQILADTEAEAPALLIDPLIYAGHQNIIFGEKGVNKSTLAYALAIFLARPEDENPLSLRVNPHPHKYIKTLVLDWETDEPTFKWYFGRLAKGMNVAATPISYRHCRLPLAQDIEPIADDIARTNSQLLIIDSLGAAASGEGGELKGSGAALDFNASLRKLPGITSLIIGQTQKSVGEGIKKSLYGSTFFTYYARNIFELCRAEDAVGGVLHLGLFHRECNFAMKSKPMGIKMTYGADNSIQLKSEPLSVTEFIEKVSAKQKILAVLKTGPKTTKQLVEETDAKRNTVDQALGRLRDEGQITKAAGDMWILYIPGGIE